MASASLVSTHGAALYVSLDRLREMGASVRDSIYSCDGSKKIPLTSACRGMAAIPFCAHFVGSVANAVGPLSWQQVHHAVTRLEIFCLRGYDCARSKQQPNRPMKVTAVATPAIARRIPRQLN